MTQSSEQFISTEDLALLKANKSKAVIRALQAERAILESQLADSEYQCSKLSLCLKYNLQEHYSIDEATGKILTSPQKEEILYEKDSRNC